MRADSESPGRRVPWGLWWVFAFLAAVPGPVQSGEAALKKEVKGRPKSQASKSRLEWVNLEEGIKAVRQKLVPALVLYRGPAARPEDASEPAPAAERKDSAELEASLRDPGLSKVLKLFVRIEISEEDLRKEYPPEGAPERREKKEARDGPGSRLNDVGSRLGIFPEKPSLIVLDFREQVVQRYEEKFPTRQRLAKELARIVEKMAPVAAEARRAEKAMEDSRYAAGLGKQREAVLIILPFDDAEVQARLDPVTRSRVAALTDEYRRLAAQRMKEADDLEAKKKFFEALMVYDKVLANFPFKDVARRCVERRLAIERKMKYGF